MQRNKVRHKSAPAASTPFCHIITLDSNTRRKLPTLILVHRKQIADQWKDQLLEFTDLEKNQIGAFDHKEQRRKGLVDIGMLQTPAKDNDLDRLIDGYDHIVIDECHHVPAVSFEAVLW